MSIRDAEAAVRVPPVVRPRRLRDRHAVYGLIATGVVLRVAVLGSTIGALDSDSAVPGLMGRRILDGDLPTFYWGQPYGGSLEAFLHAAVFAVLPPAVEWVKLVPVLLCGAAAVLTWRVGRRLVGDRAGALGAGFFWALPFTIWYSTKTGPYWAALVVMLASVLLLLRLADAGYGVQATQAGDGVQATQAGDGIQATPAGRPPWWEAGALGLCLGVAWWANPSMLLVVPITALLLGRRLVRHWRLWWAVATGFVAGAAPWILFNLRHDFISLNIGDGQIASTYGGRLRGFFSTALPMALGLRTTFTHDWLLGPIGVLLYIAALVAFVVFAVRSLRHPKLRLLCAAAAAYPVVYALSPFTWYHAQARYVVFLMPFLGLLAGRAADGPRRQWIGLGVSATIAFIGIASFPTVQPFAAGAEVPPDTSDVLSILDRQDITHAYADYWIAYRLTFESGERTIVAPITRWRYGPYQRAVAASPRPAYVFLAESPVYPRFLAAAAARGVGLVTYSIDPWIVVVPAVRVLPGDWPEVFHCPEECVPASSAWTKAAHA